jgi:hypothetical protein
MPLVLKLERLWGAPRSWTFEGEDEDALVRMLADLSAAEPDAESNTAVLYAEREGHAVGIWTRDGVRQLVATIKSGEGRLLESPFWREVMEALDAAATGP